jgi:uncharacterized repeat protein (TIGR03943 family)
MNQSSDHCHESSDLPECAHEHRDAAPEPRHHSHPHDRAHHDANGHSADEAGAATLALLDEKFFSWAGSGLLALWGGVMIYFFASGRITHYLSASGAFRIQCLIAGLVLCVLAAFNLLTTGAGEAHSHDHSHDDEHADDDEDATCSDCGPAHAHGESSWLGKIVAFVILAVPLAAAAVYSPDRYSDEFGRLKNNAKATSASTAIGGGGIDLKQRAEAKSAKAPAASETKPATPSAPGAFTVEELERLSGGRSPEGNIRLQLIELFYMPAQTQDVRDVVASQPIETVGQAVKDSNNPARLRLFRLMMTCCAADARPISIPIEFESAAPEWREMGWYKVVGTVEYREENGTPSVVFKARELVAEKPPRNQMMF